MNIIDKYLISENKKDWKRFAKIVTSSMGKKVTYSMLRELGYTDEEIKFIENVYRDVTKKASIKGRYPVKKNPDMFGGIMRFANIEEYVSDGLYKAFRKLYGKELKAK